MGNIRRLLFAFSALAWLSGPAFADQAFADQKDPRLDRLFASLQKTKQPAELRVLEAQIWTIWLRSKSDTTNLLMQQGMRAMAKREHKKGLELFTSITELEPDFAEGWNKRATLLYVMGRYRQSIADCDRVLALEPRHFGALSGLGLIYTALEEPAKALEAYENVLKVHPNARHAQQQAKALRKRIKGEKI